MAQILNGNPLLSYAIVFLQSAGFSEVQAFNINISLSGCILIGVFICWVLFLHLGRATIYISGLAFMWFTLITIGGLGWAKNNDGAQMAIGIILVISTLINNTCIGPTCYPIVSEITSDRLRYKTIAIGRFVYVCTNISQNTITPRMLAADSWNWGAKSALFYAGTNTICQLWCWFRLPETKDQ